MSNVLRRKQITLTQLVDKRLHTIPLDREGTGYGVPVSYVTWRVIARVVFTGDTGGDVCSFKHHQHRQE